MGLLDSMGAQNGQIDIQQLMQMLQMQQRDPFTKSLPGDQFLGGDQMGMENSMPQSRPMPQEGQQQSMNTVPTSFADTQPGLPNLPDSFKGFGFGQYAPEMNQGNPRQQLIQQLMQMLPQLQGMEQFGQQPDVGGF